MTELQHITALKSPSHITSGSKLNIAEKISYARDRGLGAEQLHAYTKQSHYSNWEASSQFIKPVYSSNSFTATNS